MRFRKQDGARTALFLALSAAAVTLFQNCGAQESLVNPLYDKPLATACLGPSCVQDEGYIAIQIQNPEPTFITRDVERGIDVAGYCDTGGFPQSRIYVELANQVGVVLPQYLSSAQCDSQGRFRVLIEFPANYDYNQAHSVTLIFRAVNQAGQELNHPAGLNRRQLTLLTAP